MEQLYTMPMRCLDYNLTNEFSIDTTQQHHEDCRRLPPATPLKFCPKYSTIDSGILVNIDGVGTYRKHRFSYLAT